MDQKRIKSRTQAYKDMMAPENKENFNTENQHQTNANNVNTKKGQIKSLKPALPNARYFETQAEKMGLPKKEFSHCVENPQKNASLLPAQNLQTKKPKTVRGNNIIKIELNPSENEKEHLMRTEILSTLEPKETKAKFTAAVVQVKNAANKKAEKTGTNFHTETSANFTETGAPVQSENSSLNNNQPNNPIINNNNINNVNLNNEKINRNFGYAAAPSEKGIGGLRENINSQAHGKTGDNDQDLVLVKEKTAPEKNENFNQKAERILLAENYNNKTNNNNNKANNNNHYNAAENLNNENNIKNNNHNNLKNNNNNQALTKNAKNANKATKPLAKAKKPTTMSDYIDKENVILIRNYGTEIYNYMRSIESVGIPSNFLDRHKINAEIRTKMVDWMVEVLSVYKCEQETFFLSVYIMDSYIFKSPAVITTDDVHVIGMTAMFVASKFEDVIPIRMSSLVSKIGHDLFSE